MFAVYAKASGFWGHVQDCWGGLRAVRQAFMSFFFSLCLSLNKHSDRDYAKRPFHFREFKRCSVDAQNMVLDGAKLGQ